MCFIWSMQMTISTLNLLTPWLQSVHTFNNPYTGARLHGEEARSISPTKHNASQFTSDIMESSSCTKKRNDSLCEHKYGKRSNSLKQGHLSCKTFCNSIDMYFNVKLVQIAWKNKLPGRFAKYVPIWFRYYNYICYSTVKFTLTR